MDVIQSTCTSQKSLSIYCLLGRINERLAHGGNEKHEKKSVLRLYF